MNAFRLSLLAATSLAFGVVASSLTAGCATDVTESDIAVTSAPLEGGRSIGIVQYNAKAGQGGWTNEGGMLDRQVAMLETAVRDRGVDVIALEQADAKAGVPGPIASDLLRAKGLTGWKTIVSVCNKDVTQLAYSPEWELVPSRGNPLVDGASPQRGFVPGGCTHGDGRPYNMAYLQRKDAPTVKVLFVVAHLPHLTHGKTTADWNLDQFNADLRTTAGTQKLSDVRIVMAGDMNELGDRGEAKGFVPLLKDAGWLRMSADLHTCCADGTFRFEFDRVVTNGPAILESVILGDTYPMNPGAKKNEEHKAIFARVAL